MKVLNPQSASLTTAEVHHFFTTNPARKPDKRIGGYETVDLRGHHAIRKDFDRYVQRASPHVLNYPAPQQWMRPVLSRLKALGLTKAEALMIINLGIGLSSSNSDADAPPDAEMEHDGTNGTEADIPMETNGTVEHEVGEGSGGQQGEDSERDDSLILSAVIEELDARLNEEQQKQVLQVLRECIVNGQADEDVQMSDEASRMTGE